MCSQTRRHDSVQTRSSDNSKVSSDGLQVNGHKVAINNCCTGQKSLTRTQSQAIFIEGHCNGDKSISYVYQEPERNEKKHHLGTIAAMMDKMVDVQVISVSYVGQRSTILSIIVCISCTNLYQEIEIVCPNPPQKMARDRLWSQQC